MGDRFKRNGFILLIFNEKRMNYLRNSKVLLNISLHESKNMMKEWSKANPLWGVLVGCVALFFILFNVLITQSIDTSLVQNDSITSLFYLSLFVIQPIISTFLVSYFWRISPLHNILYPSLLIEYWYQSTFKCLAL